MRTSEPPPSPWEIWHARFNFDRHGYKFRPVLVLSRAPSGLLAAMNIDSEATALSTKHGMAQGNNHQSHYDLHATTSISLDKGDHVNVNIINLEKALHPIQTPTLRALYSRKLRFINILDQQPLQALNYRIKLLLTTS